MSHFTRVRTQLHHLDTVRRALEDLGYTVGKGDVRGFGDQHVVADLVVRVDGSHDIGFRQTRGSVEMVADFWEMNINQQEFLQKVTQRYAHLTVLDQAAKQGFAVVAEETLEDGSVRLVMQRWS